MPRVLHCFLLKYLGVYAAELLLALAVISVTLPSIAVAAPVPAISNLLQDSSSPPPTTDLPVWLGADGKPLPFQNDEEIKEFLRTAPVVSMEKIPEGVTHPRKVLLEKDGMRMHAIFRDANIFKRKWDSPSGRKLNFRDDAIFEGAAYELSKLLGLNNVPPTVRRKIEGKKGTLQVWIENAMTEETRQTNKVEPPDKRRWLLQHYVMWIFDNLIYNEDRNQGNILIGSDWKMWLIDATRAFRTYRDLRNPEVIRYCERKLWENLKKLDETVIKERLGEFLRSQEISTLVHRRNKLVEHIQKLIDQRGERAVLFTFK
ncbi:MAG: hypothetical protein ACE5MK_03305 [Acidobacteriota bacterium]